MKKKVLICTCIALILSIFAGITDYSKVHGFERPRCCILINGADDGGSGTYVGLGYSFDIKGNFMPEDKQPGVAEYAMKLLGIPAVSGGRV